MTVRLLTEQLPAYFLKKPRFLSSSPLPKYRGELFTTTTDDFVVKDGQTYRDRGMGARARQEIDPQEPLRYKRARKVQPEPLGEPLDTRVLTEPMVWRKKSRRSAEVQPPGGEVYR